MSEVESFVRFCDSEFGTRVMDREAAYLEQYLRPGDRTLDVGSGIGSVEERLPHYDIIGVEISNEMVQTARSRVGGQFLVGDARGLPIATDSVASVFFVATLEFIPEAETALDEAYRVLDPEGQLVALVLNTKSGYVQSQLEREGSYFQRMVHRDSDQLVSLIEQRIDGESEYFLGLDDKKVFETVDPKEAAIVAIAGSPTT